MTSLVSSPEISDEVQELASHGRDGRLGWWIAGAFFIGLLGWATLMPLDAGAVAQGMIAVAGNKQVVQHQYGGVITSLSVQEGQDVKKGDVLLQVSGGQLLAAERGMTGELFTLYAQRARLEAELSGAAEMKLPVELQNLPALDQPLADQAMNGQRTLLNARRSARSDERSVLKRRIAQNQSQIGAYEHQMGSNKEQQRLLGEELVGVREMAAKGYYPVNRLRETERDAARLNGDYGALRADVARTGQAIGETQMQIVTLGSKALEEVATEMRDVQLRIGDTQPKLFATREQLSQSSIRATASGKVVGLQVHTVGGIVAAGQTLMEIVPQNRDLLIEAKLSPTDADDVRMGMETQIRFSGVQERSLPILHGKVSKVSADSMEDQRTGVRYFTMEVTIPSSEQEKVHKAHGVALSAGLPADVMVTLRSRTAFSYLVEPFTKMLWTSGHEQ